MNQYICTNNCPYGFFFSTHSNFLPCQSINCDPSYPFPLLIDLKEEQIITIPIQYMAFTPFNIGKYKLGKFNMTNVNFKKR